MQKNHLQLGRVCAFATIAVGAFVWGACSSDAARQCNVGADCASGACNADGTCVAIATNGNDASTTDVTDSGTKPDASGTYVEDAGGMLACASGDAGVLTQADVPLAAGLSATFRIATNETIDTAGTDNGDGTKSWDFSGALASDQNQIISTLSPAGTWWASSFATATYATTLSSTATTLGVFDYGTNALTLVGAVSPTSDGVTETKVTYATPIPILDFPLHNGQTWSTTSTVSGTYEGVAMFYTEEYDSSVDAVGSVKTPYATFAALRVNTLLTHTLGALVTKTRTYAWVTGCFGTIAKATSASTDDGSTPGENFTQAAELERLAP
jgi:hypothetical protein